MKALFILLALLCGLGACVMSMLVVLHVDSSNLTAFIAASFLILALTFAYAAGEK